jgi:hypothetical protein
MADDYDCSWRDATLADRRRPQSIDLECGFADAFPMQGFRVARAGALIAVRRDLADVVAGFRVGLSGLARQRAFFAVERSTSDDGTYVRMLSNPRFHR